MKNAIINIITSYAGTSLTRKVLHDIRHRYLMKCILLTRCTSYVHYSYYRRHMFVGVKRVRFCSCRGVSDCQHPECPCIFHFVTIVSAVENEHPEETFLGWL